MVSVQVSLLIPHEIEPSENWDDDFEFNHPRSSGSPPNRIQRPKASPPGLEGQTPGTRMSIASSEYTMEDWDADSQFGGGEASSPPSPSRVEDGTPTRRGRVLSGGEHTMVPVPISMALAAWSEEMSGDPKTPVKNNRFPSSSTDTIGDRNEGEIWDDDYEDRTFSSPGRKGKRRTVEDEDAHESWDDEFAAEEKDGEGARLGMGPPPPASRRTPVKGRRKRISKRPSSSSSSESENEEKASKAKLRYSMSEDGDFYDSDEGEFGYSKEDEDEDEEDRTVTARSKRGMHHRNRHIKESPPPPVPRLPFLTSPVMTASGSSPRPFPRSPTSSVFSVPATLADARTYTSTTNLHSTISRGSSGGGTSLSHLPPSPPIHKHRERRRLRKKSRPSNQGTYEMATFSGTRRSGSGSGEGIGYMYSFSDGELEDIREKEREKEREEGVGDRILPRREMTPEVTATVPVPVPVPVPAEVGVPPATPRGAGALLSRIGSVTSKWGKGRRRSRGASMTPSEIERDAQLALRSQSSMSSLNQHTSNSASPPLPSNPNAAAAASSSSSNWFFRTSSNQSQYGATTTTCTSPSTKSKSKYAPRSMGRGHELGQTGARPRVSLGGEDADGDSCDDDVEEHEANRNLYGYGEFDKTPVATPVKLVKRSSMGFVALRRGFGGPSRYRDKGNEMEGDGENGNGVRPLSMHSSGSRGARGEGQKRRGVSDTYRTGPEGEADPFVVGASNNVDANANKGNTNTKEEEKEKETTASRDLGLRSIMGNVRRLSIVGVAGRDRARHKRTQSSAAAGSPSAIASAVSNASTASSSSPGLIGRISASSGWSRPLTPSTSVPQLRSSIDIKVKTDNTSPTTTTVLADTKTNGDSDTVKTPSKSGMKSSGSLRGEGDGGRLPPIELQHPSPSPLPRDGSGKDWKAGSPRTGPLSSVLRTPHSPGQSASLGRASPFVVAASSNVASPSGGSTPVNAGSNLNSSVNSNSSTIKDLPAGTTTVLRRNSLGDLKIPARISQAQVSLRRDLGMVREFAGHVESLKVLQNTYNELSGEIHALLDQHAAAHARAQVQQALVSPPSRPSSRSQTSHSQSSNHSSQSPNPSNGSNARATSPMGFFALANLSRTHLGLNLKGRRRRSQTNPEGSAAASVSTLSFGPRAVDGGDDFSLAASTSPTSTTPSQAAYKELATALYTINSKYRISWECAELLIELGGGSASGDGSNPNNNLGVAAAVPQRSSSRTSTTRERAVTLAGDERPGTPVQGSLSRPGSRVGSYSSSSSSHPHHPQQHISVNTNAHYNHNHAPPMSLTLNSVGMSTAVPLSTTSPPLASPPSWRASTGRHDLSQRQLSLLKDMLNHPEGSRGVRQSSPMMQPGSRLSIPEEPSGFGNGGVAVNREWRWGEDVMGSTVTLPPSDQDGEESGVGTDRTGGGGGGGAVKQQQQKKKRLMNMSGFRDILRALRRGVQVQGAVGGTDPQPPQLPTQVQVHQALLARTKVAAAAASTTSLSAASSLEGHSVHSPMSQKQTQRRVIQKRRPRSSTGLEDKWPNSTTPYTNPPPTHLPPPSSFPMPPKSPRRPSLASIFRIGTSSNGPHAKNSSNTKTLGPVPLSATDSNQSRSSSSCYPDDDDDGDGGEEEDWDQIDSASDLDLDGALGVAGVNEGSTIRVASPGKRRKKVTMIEGRGSGGGGASVSGKRSPYLQQDPYAYRSSSGMGRRIVSAGTAPSGSSSSVNTSQTSLVGSVKEQEALWNRNMNANATGVSGSNTANGSVRQSSKLSDVQENAREPEWRPVRNASLARQSASITPQKRTASPGHSVMTNRSVSGGGKMGNKTGSVRSMPPQPFSPSSVSSSGMNYVSPGVSGGGMMSSNYPDIKLTFTPENIRPLLENAREVQTRLKECVEEMRVLVRKEDRRRAQAGESRPR